MNVRMIGWVLILVACPPTCLMGDVTVVTTFPGNKGPGWKDSIDAAGAVGPHHVVDFDVAGFVVHAKSNGKILIASFLPSRLT